MCMLLKKRLFGYLLIWGRIKMNARQLRYMSYLGTIVAAAFLTLFIEYVVLFV